MYGIFYLQTQRQDLSQQQQERKVAASSSNPTEAPAKELLLVSSIIKASLPNHPDTAQLAHLIVTESRNAGVDPLFVTAVVKAESMFKSRAISNRGARGLMQLMPKTGDYVSALADRSKRQKIDLHDPTTNLRLGIAYLKYLDQRFAGDKHQTLIAYNWGPTNLSKALRAKRSLPEQSVQYAHKVLLHHDQWKSSLDTGALSSDATAVG
jgi:soluble lytic murein transglycosylase-like protein